GGHNRIASTAAARHLHAGTDRSFRTPAVELRAIARTFGSTRRRSYSRRTLGGISNEPVDWGRSPAHGIDPPTHRRPSRPAGWTAARCEGTLPVPRTTRRRCRGRVRGGLPTICYRPNHRSRAEIRSYRKGVGRLFFEQ